MLWRTAQVLHQKYLRVKAESNKQARGLLLEEFLADLFAVENYRSDQNLLANRRQVDLFVARGPLRLVVEAKYLSRPAEIEHVDQLRTRLEESPPDVTGLLVSMSGFSAEAIRRTEDKTSRPVLLLDGDELDNVVQRGGGLHELLTQKREHLTRYQRALFLSHPLPPPLTTHTTMPDSGYRIVTPEGVDLPWWTTRDGLVGAICAPAFSHVDWSASLTVNLDLSLDIHNEAELVELLRRLSRLGRLTTEGSWRIEQVATSWNGFGPANLVEALAQRAERYAHTSTHHSESVFYIDHLDDGIFTLAADVHAANGRVGWCSLSFVLNGWPLDSSPFEGLVAELPVINRPVVEFGRDHAIATHNLRKPGRRNTTTASAHAYLVRDATLFEGQAAASERIWVEGVVLNDPLAGQFKRTKHGLPAEPLDTMFTWLRSQHHLSDDFQYEYQHVRTMHTRDVQVVHLTTDWVTPAPNTP